MRLARPKFYEGPSMGIDPADEFSGLINDAVKVSSGQENMQHPMTSYLMAPQVIE